MKKEFMFSVLSLLCIMAGFSACSDDEPAGPVERPAPTLNASDSLALVDIYKAADGDHWFVPWDLHDIYTWGGVGAAYDSVHNEYRVVYLMINQNSSPNPQGHVSLERVGDLPYLMMLTAGGERMTCTLDEKLFRLPYLKTVRMSCYIGTELPGYVFQAPSLERLDLSSTGFYGELPEEIAEWDNPKGICQLWYNHLTGKVPSGIDIRLLELHYNEYTEYPFEYCFDRDTEINMSYNYITGVIPDSVLNDLHALVRLRAMTLGQLDGCDFSNPPEWWDSPFWPDPDEEEESSATSVATRSLSSGPLKTRMEILTDVKLP